jgi:hypothetical protein
MFTINGAKCIKPSNDGIGGGSRLHLARQKRRRRDRLIVEHIEINVTALEAALYQR